MDDQRTNQTTGGVKFRKLRIAWSVSCGVACLLLIVLWVRSYFREDALLRTTPTLVVEIASHRGRLTFLRNEGTGADGRIEMFKGSMPTRTVFLSNPLGEVEMAGLGEKRFLGFKWNRWESVTTVSIPYWFIILSIAGMATVPWSQRLWRFSLRTLLIGITVAAIGVGWIVYALR